MTASPVPVCVSHLALRIDWLACCRVCQKKLCNQALDHHLCRLKFQAQLDTDRKFIQAVIAHDDDMVPQLKKMMETLNCWPEIDDIEQDEMPNGSICKASGQKGGIKRVDLRCWRLKTLMVTISMQKDLCPLDIGQYKISP